MHDAGWFSKRPCIIYRGPRHEQERGQTKDMKKRLIMAAVFLVLAGGALNGVRAAEEQKGPRIEFQQDRHDAGKVRQGEQAVHVFEFTNTGDEVLVINKVETS